MATVTSVTAAWLFEFSHLKAGHGLLNEFHALEGLAGELLGLDFSEHPLREVMYDVESLLIEGREFCHGGVLVLMRLFGRLPAV
jgi:hypothetical protein